MGVIDQMVDHAGLRLLPWDSEHFGFPVARIASWATDCSLHKALTMARQSGARLVYYEANPDRPVAADLLAEFGGLLVDQKARFAARRIPNTPRPSVLAEDGFQVREYEVGPALPVLQELAVAAGTHSRFRVDPGVPHAKFVHLFTTWIERSTRREIADVVLVAVGGADDTICGMVTAAVQGDEGTIGLIGVTESVRGRGVGRLLLRGVHQWMEDRGITRSVVVTQWENRAAVGLYERVGYTLSSLRMMYHFWPQGPLASSAQHSGVA